MKPYKQLFKEKDEMVKLDNPDLTKAERQVVETEIKYSGYIQRQVHQI